MIHRISEKFTLYAVSEQIFYFEAVRERLIAYKYNNKEEFFMRDDVEMSGELRKKFEHDIEKLTQRIKFLKHLLIYF